MNRPRTNFWEWQAVLNAGLLLLAGFSAAEEKPLTEEALVLNSARRAYNEQDHRFAAERFREFLARFPNSVEAIYAKLGLAMAVLDSGLFTEEDCQTAVTRLAEVVNVQDYPQRPVALYYLGAGCRELGRMALAKAVATPDKATEFLGAAVNHFQTAATHLAAAADALRAGLPAPEEGKPLSDKWEWVARARCDQIEALLRAGKVPEGADAAERLLADAQLKTSRFRDLALYLRGFAAYRLGTTAGVPDAQRQEALAKCTQSLSEVKAVEGAIVGDFPDHAQYLLGRAQHLTGKAEPALQAYEKVVTRCQQARQQAVETLKNPEALKDKPAERDRLDKLAKSPPEHVVRAQFYQASLLFEQNTFDKALEAFSAFATSNPDSALAPDATLRRGICLWQLKRYPECTETLTKLVAASPRLADQAQLWLGKAQVSSGDPAKPEEYAKSLQAGVESFGKAAEMLKAPAATDAQAKARLIDALLHLADTQMLAKKYDDAAVNYQQMLALGVAAKQNEELLYRQATALQLATKYPESDALCTKFRDSFPQSNLLPQVLFRSAENAFFQAAALEQQLPKETPDRADQMKKAFTDAAGRYQVVLDKAPDFPEINLARLGLGTAHYRAGTYEAANAALATIPADQMKGELGQAALLRADCLLRLVPEPVKDDAALAKLNADMTEAVNLLSLFLTNNPQSPERPQVLLKLGLCHQLRAENQATAEERAKASKLAVDTYDIFLQQFAAHALAAQVTIEKAKSLITGGEADKGLAELHKFTQAPLNASPLAPLALLREAMALRAANKPVDAAALLDQTRKQSEQNLLNSGSPGKDWAILMHFQHGQALKDADKLPEAKALMEDFLNRYPDRPEAPEAALRVGQGMAAEARTALEAAQAVFARPDASPEEKAAAQTKRQNAFRGLETAAEYLKQVLATQDKQPNSPAWPRVNYELAWCYRLQFDDHFESSRRQAAQPAKPEPAEKTEAKGADPASKVPYHPSEAPMAEHYKAVIEKWPDLPIAMDAQFELAEYLVRRGRHELAVTHLSNAVAKPSREDLKPKIHFLLGSCVDEAGKTEEALMHYEEVCRNLGNPLAPYAAFRAGEALLRLNAPDRAVAKFQLFADQAAFQTVPGLSDRGLLRLAAAQSQLGNHAASQQTCETLLTRFAASPFVHQARFIIGQALQAQNQVDAAVKTYTDVVTATTEEVAARAQFQIGMCRLQKQLYTLAGFDFLKVVHSYNYPEWSAAALLKAAECAIGDNNPNEAKKHLQRLLKEFPDSQHVDAAKQRLAFLEGKEAPK
jgi:tetratricopeptide (TPR) repeat protein